MTRHLQKIEEERTPETNQNFSLYSKQLGFYAMFIYVTIESN